MIDLKSINLNLLVVLDALLTESNVSLAADCLDLSQPAVSHALKQLREIYQDQLLVRTQHSVMELTPLAKSLKTPVKKALEEIQSVFKGNMPFIPEETTWTFRVGLSDYLSFILIPRLTQLCENIAPKMKIVLHHLNYLQGVEDFKHQQLDLVLGSFDDSAYSLKSQRLFEDKGVYVMHAKHPLATQKKLTLKATAAYPHIMVSYIDNPNDTFIDRIYRKSGFDNVSHIVVPHAYMALYGVANSMMLTHTVTRLAEPFVKPFNLVLKESPFDVPNYVAKQYWLPSMQDDPAHRWLRQRIKELAVF